ncbi:MAG TPA: Ig-like domain-containing protein, partial [Geobacteraceae bacterium]|nr:Ig-like domain-containing protein [Geobacteraceae bacterium]
STRDITQFVTWISTVPSVASISNVGNQKGLATGVKVGSTVITAALGSIVSANDTLTVTNAVLQTITITPPIPPATTVTMASKTSQQFTATGHFDNGTAQDLTLLVTWSTSDKTIVAISNATSTKGVATGVIAGGPITITASFKGISGTASVTVVNATLTGITIQPSTATVAVGATQQFLAIGSFTGGFTQDLTKAVKWSSSNKNVAITSNGFNSRGLTTAIAVGSTTITATKPSTVISGTATMTVI